MNIQLSLVPYASYLLTVFNYIHVAYHNIHPRYSSSHKSSVTFKTYVFSLSSFNSLISYGDREYTCQYQCKHLKFLTFRIDKIMAHVALHLHHNDPLIPKRF